MVCKIEKGRNEFRINDSCLKAHLSPIIALGAFSLLAVIAVIIFGDKIHDETSTSRSASVRVVGLS